MRIGLRKVFPSIYRILAESFDRGELNYRPIGIFKAVNEINKIYMSFCDNLAATLKAAWNRFDVETCT